MHDKTYRVGQIVPSSNVTMETEVPAMLHRARVADDGVRFTFHSSRAPMKTVSEAELTAMNGHMARCAQELMDADMDIIASACLVAIMCQGIGFHRTTETALSAEIQAAGKSAPVITSAGALVEALTAIGAKRIALITPYMRPLTALVVSYLEHEGFSISDAVSLEVSDNLAVARLPQAGLVERVKTLNTGDVDAVVLSACVQMPSLEALPVVQAGLDVPVLSTAAATVFTILRRLGLSTDVPDAGGLLSGAFD